MKKISQFVSVDDDGGLYIFPEEALKLAKLPVTDENCASATRVLALQLRALLTGTKFAALLDADKSNSADTAEDWLKKLPS